MARALPRHQSHQPETIPLVDPSFMLFRSDRPARNSTTIFVDTVPVMADDFPRFDHHRLDAFTVAREALRMGDALARRLPRGYATLQDQLRRSLLAAYLGIAEASSRSGADRIARFRCARGEASEAAAALEAVSMLRLASPGDIAALISLLDRLCAMLTRLAGFSRPSR